MYQLLHKSGSVKDLDNKMNPQLELIEKASKDNF